MDNPAVLAKVMAAVAAGTLVLCLIGRLFRDKWAAGTWAVLLALAIAPLATDRPFLGTAPAWRSTDPNAADPAQRVILAGVAIAALAAALAARRWPTWPRGVLAVAVAAAVVRYMLAAFPTPPPEVHGQATFAALAAAGLWLLLEPLAVGRPTSPAVPWTCGCLAAGVALLNLFSTNTNPAAVALAVGGVAGGAFLATLTTRAPSFAGGPVAVVAAVLPCVAVANRLGGGEITLRQWLILGSAAAAAWLVELPGVRRLPVWVREPLRMALVAVPVLIVVVPAYHAWVLEQEQAGG